MSEAEATRFIEETFSNADLSDRLAKLADDSDMVFAEVLARGFDVTPHEVREALLEKLVTHVSEAELAQIAAGTDYASPNLDKKKFGIVIGSVTGGIFAAGGVIIAACAAGL